MERIFEKLDRYFCRKWRLAVLDMDRGRWIVKPETSNIPYLKAENANGRHILIQPDSTLDPYYSKLGDIPSMDLFVPPDEVSHNHRYLFRPM